MKTFGKCQGIRFEGKDTRVCGADGRRVLKDGTVYCLTCHRQYVNTGNWLFQGHRGKSNKPRN